MQQLQFEASWDKALAAKDRLKIHRIFSETKHQDQSGILFSPISEAINHKEALLVTVLVHNFTSDALNFRNARLVYSVHGEAIAEETFTQPALTIPPNVSMPWTFIFPKGSYDLRATFEEGQLEVL